MQSADNSAQEIFSRSLDCDSPEKLADFLDDACGSDTTLRERVEKLLQAHSRAGDFLGGYTRAEATNATGETKSTETQVGQYKLLEVIGEGGMGTVYMAKQTEPVNRRVALKLIKTGMDTRQVVARFEAERQALAMMDHPNIAKVLDAGATESGRPYFVMELVKGKPITNFCDEQHLDVDSRLKLFQQVCHAVQHAHQKGIIHRDIKPSNVLVAMYDDKPVPKVIDFGVAKATGDELTEKTMFTRFGQIVGTLEYMSPEQAQFNQKDIDTRSDIYSLGAVLYELLSGQPPFDQEQLKSQALDETLRMIREDEPTKPSTKLSGAVQAVQIASSRKSSTEKLGSILRGDLDWIVMKALEKDRTRRYETANEFASDVNRYLENEPVHAGSPTAAYRFKKFAKRNRGKLAAGSVITALLLLVCAAFGYATFNGWYQQQKTRKALAASEQDRERLEGLSNFMITGLISKAKPDGVNDPDISVRAAIVELKEELDDLLPDSPDVRAWVKGELGNYLLNIWEIEESATVLGAAYSELGEFKGQKDPATLWVGKNLAFCLSHLGRHEEAAKLAREVAMFAEAAHGDVPAVAECWQTLGVALHRAGRLDESERAFRRSINMGNRIGSNNAAAIGNLGDIYVERKDLKKAEELYLEALRLRQQDEKDHVETMRVMDDLALCYIGQKKTAEAKRILDKLLKQKYTIFGEHHRSNLDTLNALAQLDYELGKFEAALQWIEQAIESSSKMFGEKNQNTLTYKNNRILILRDLRRWNEAKTRCEELIKDLETLQKTNPNNIDNLTSIGMAYWQLGMVLGFDQKHEAAVDPYTTAVGMFEKQLESDSPGLGVRQNLCDTLRQRSKSLRHLRRFEESIADAAQARTLTDSLDEQLDCDLLRAQVFAEMGRYDEAINIAEEVLKKLDDEGYLLVRSAAIYGICLNTLVVDEVVDEKNNFYVDRALELLQQAADLGELDAPYSHLQLKENPDFAALHEHDEFNLFLVTLATTEKDTSDQPEPSANDQR